MNSWLLQLLPITKQIKTIFYCGFIYSHWMSIFVDWQKLRWSLTFVILILGRNWDGRWHLWFWYLQMTFLLLFIPNSEVWLNKRNPRQFSNRRIEINSLYNRVLSNQYQLTIITCTYKQNKNKTTQVSHSLIVLCNYTKLLLIMWHA